MHDHVALATLHDHLSEIDAIVAVSAQFSVENDLQPKRVCSLVSAG